jgi:hypothetical protein
MHNLSLLEECYKKFVKKLPIWIPEDIYFINLELLHSLDLLHFQPNAEHKDSTLTRYFHIIESPEKITLLNDEFVIWIVSEKFAQASLTYTLIALNRGEQEPQLEVAFVASGVYNSSKLVLKVLEKFLLEIQETEITLVKLKEIE